jgi:hypothetical protein
MKTPEQDSDGPVGFGASRNSELQQEPGSEMVGPEGRALWDSLAFPWDY